MTRSQIPQDPTIGALAAVWASLRALVDELSADEWAAATVLPGWDVQANVAHVIGTEMMLLGEPTPDAKPGVGADHVRNDIGEFNEVWVRALAARAPAEVLAVFDDVTSRRLAALRAMPAAEWDAESFTPAGRDTYGRFMQIRVFDCWFHEQDIREAVGRPGHDAGPAVDVTLDEVSTALGFVVGKRAGVPQGTTVTFGLSGEGGRPFHVEVAERARVVDALAGPATVTIAMPVVPFTRLCGGRTTVDTVRSQVTVEGDHDIAEQILANLAYTI